MGGLTKTKFGIVKSVTITNAQMLACHTTPVIIIPASANLIWIPFMVAIASDTTPAAYATAATFTIGNGTQEIAFTLAHSGLSSGAKRIAFAYNVTALNSTDQATLINAPVTFTADADPTGGNVANIVKLQVFYNTIPAVA